MTFIFILDLMTILSYTVIIEEVMNMPRALTKQEKCRQCRRLLEKGKAVVFSQGIRKTSVVVLVHHADVSHGTGFFLFC